MYRDRFFLILIFGVILFFVLSLLLGELSFEEHKRILFDLGISAIHWLNLGLCLFIGGTSLRREIERQTYMTLLASPINRLELVLGKFGGVLVVAAISTCLLGIGLLLMLNSFGDLRNFSVVLIGIVAEAAVLLSVSMFMSLVLSPFVGLFASVGVFLVGNWLESLKYFADKSKSDLYINFADSMAWIFPNLYRFNWRSIYVLESGIPVNIGMMTLLHGLAWVGIFLFSSHIIFKHKDLI
jgi:ABC-type transport system involved in multi-copper enzyme maturation permease subunit